MRLLRLRVGRFRAIEEREVAFAPIGVTLVQGPNEVGKSSLAEAIDLLFDFLDSSTDRRVKAVQPVGRDVGSEVEAEVETGPYRFWYRKRFHRDRETRLELLTPTPEVVAGREAHERVSEILDETLDRGLWRALRVIQGEAVALPSLSASGSLLAALDRAAAPGAGAAGQREEDLFTRAVEESRLYFTERRGQPTGELRAAREAAEAAREALEAAEEELAAVAADAARSDEIEALLPELVDRADASRRAAQVAADEASRVDRLAAEVEASAARLADEEGRLGLLRELAGALSAEAELAGRRQRAGRRLQAAEADLEPALAAAREAAAARRSAELEVRRRRLAERVGARDRARRLAAELAEFEARRAATAVTSEELERLEERSLELVRAEAAVAAGSARIEVTALDDIELAVDGETVPLTRGERFARRAEAPVVVALAGRLEMAVVPGGGLAELAEQRDRAAAAFAEACAWLGVADLVAARRAAAERRALEAEIGATRAALGEALGGIAGKDAAARTEELAASVAAEVAELGAEPPAAASPELARSTLAAAEEELVRSAEEVAAREAVVRRLGAARDGAREVLAEADVELRAAGERRVRARQRIGTLRRAVAESPPGSASREELQTSLFHEDLPEAEVEAAVCEAERTTAGTREALAAARGRLASARPEQAAGQAAEAAAEAARAAAELRAAEDELREVRGRLAARGEQGLYERAGSARAELAAAERRRSAVEARAAAAQKLLTALAAARDGARAAYRAPLREKIGELGRRLFGPDFAVELDDDLAVVRRTLGGVRLGFDQLSSGAREQVALLARVACALLVAPDGGVPLVIDDALGYSDAQRLRAMGEVLAEAGRSCQVIVLTSSPERFRSVTGARVVRLERPAD